jgi:uncharacterized protein (TIGR00251 family)
MKITIKVKPNSKENKIEEDDFGIFNIWVTALPEKGKANRQVIEILSNYFKVPKSSINIVCGEKSKSKIIEINK